jgi:hypothetical protein
MASKGQFTGMTGVYLVAAELSKKGFIACVTSRNAIAADLLVTDINGLHSFAVQVKTNAKTFNFWLMNAKTKELISKSLIYVLVNLRKNIVEYFLVPSSVIAEKLCVGKRPDSTWYFVDKKDIEEYRDKWSIFDG